MKERTLTEPGLLYFLEVRAFKIYFNTKLVHPAGNYKMNLKKSTVCLKKGSAFVHNVLHYSAIHCYVLFISITVFAQTGDVIFVHDPCIIKSDNYYYIFSTGDRIEMRRSTDMQRWQRLKQVFPAIPEWGKQEVPGITNIWAPDIFYRDSTFYLYYSLSTFGSNRSRIGLATNKTLNPDSPSYQWIDKGKVIESNSGDSYNAIDPNVARDRQGRLWLSFGSYWSGIKLVELDSTTMKPKDGASFRSIAGRPNWGAIEAPYIIFKNGYYYLFASFDACCQGVNSTYKIRVGRSENISGTYKDKNDGSMLNGGGSLILKSNDRWRGPGHCAVLQEDDTTWLVHHAYDAENNGIPTLRIEKLIWDENDWPMVEMANSLQDSRETIPPKQLILYQNYPNPFNPDTKIPFEMPEAGFITLNIYDINGELIKTLLNQKMSTGHHEVLFNANYYASGIYFYIIKTGRFKAVKKMILLD